MSTKIIKDLNSVANIVGGLGLSIAEAQHAMNLGYLDAVERLVILATALQKQIPSAEALEAKGKADEAAKKQKAYQDLADNATTAEKAAAKKAAEDAASTAADAAAKATEAAKNITDDDKKFVQGFLAQFAPTRYQYGQTTLKVRLDLAQTLNASGSVGVGVGFGAIAVNASAAFAYGSQYQAAAEISTVIHAVPTDPKFDLGGLATRAASANSEKLTLPARATEIDKATAETSGRIINKLLGIETPKVETETTPEKKTP